VLAVIGSRVKCLGFFVCCIGGNKQCTSRHLEHCSQGALFVYDYWNGTVQLVAVHHSTLIQDIDFFKMMRGFANKLNSSDFLPLSLFNSRIV